jgi:hypothetical protein
MLNTRTFWQCQRMKKKCPKSVDKCDGSMVESGTQYHRQLGVNNNNGLQYSTVTLGPTFGVGVSQFWVDRQSVQFSFLVSNDWTFLGYTLMSCNVWVVVTSGWKMSEHKIKTLWCFLFFAMPSSRINIHFCNFIMWFIFKTRREK